MTATASRRRATKGRRGTPPLRACPVCGAERRRWDATTLCWDCYRQSCVGGGGTPLPTRAPAVPTATAPGTPERVDVYAARAAAGERLYHPGDARDCSGLVGHPGGASVLGRPRDYLYRGVSSVKEVEP